MSCSARVLLVLLPLAACGANKTNPSSETALSDEASNLIGDEGDASAGPEASGAASETDGSEDSPADAPEPADESPPADASAISLALCSRLEDPQRPAHTTTLSIDVERTYLRLLYLDCAVGRMVTDDEDTLPDFQNALISWNLSFWGCRAQGTSHFGILREGFGDATPDTIGRLVEHYVAAANQALLLSPPEELAMREALAVLSAAVVSEADAFTLSTCAGEAGTFDDSGDAGSFDGE